MSRPQDRNRRGAKTGGRSPPLGAEGGSPGGSPGKPCVSPNKGLGGPHLMQQPDGADSDERNPDIIPDQIDGDVQVSPQNYLILVLFAHVLSNWLL